MYSATVSFMLIAFLIGISAVDKIHGETKEQKADLCGGAVDGDSGFINYGTNELLKQGDVCVWTIHLDTARDFKFTFSNLNVTATTNECLDGGVRIYALSNLVPAGNIESYTFCDKHPSENAFYLGYNVAVVVLYVDETNTQPGSGFRLNWEGNGFDSLRTKHSSSFSQVSEAIIRYPISGDYSTSIAATWLINSAQTAQALTDIQFNNIGLEACSNPMDSCTCDAVVLYQISPAGFLNETRRFCGETNGGVFNGAESRFIIAFFTDIEKYGDGGLGFEAIYRPSNLQLTTVEPTTEQTTTHAPTTEESTTSEPSTTTEVTSTTPAPYLGNHCGEIFKQDEGTISYKSEEKYSDNERCSWTILVSKEKITLDLVSSGVNFENAKIQVAGMTFRHYVAEGPIDNIESYPLEVNGTMNITRSWIIVTFASNMEQGGATGFVLNFKAFGSPAYTTYPSLNSRHFIHNATSTAPVTMQHPVQGLYYDYEMSTFLISMPKFQRGNSGLWVDYYQISLEDRCLDLIYVYTFGSTGWSLNKTLCDDVQTDHTLHDDMILFVFISDQSQRYNGFGLHWFYTDLNSSE